MPFWYMSNTLKPPLSALAWVITLLTGFFASSSTDLHTDTKVILLKSKSDYVSLLAQNLILNLNIQAQQRIWPVLYTGT